MLNIDFDCLFDKGKSLPIPEIVNFRLTKNIVNGLGCFKCYGIFRILMIDLMKFFNKNCGTILGYLDSFIYDPLIEIST